MLSSMCHHTAASDQRCRPHPDQNARRPTCGQLRYCVNRRWNQILFEEEVQAKATQLKFNSDYKVYSNRKRAKALFEVEMPGGLKCSLLASIRPHGDLKDHIKYLYYVVKNFDLENSGEPRSTPPIVVRRQGEPNRTI